MRDPDGYWHEPWLRACALRALPGRVESARAQALAAPWRDDDDPAVAQTARWVGWIAAGGGTTVAGQAGPGRSVQVRR